MKIVFFAVVAVAIFLLVTMQSQDQSSPKQAAVVETSEPAVTQEVDAGLTTEPVNPDMKIKTGASTELPADLQAQLNAPPPELPDDLREQLEMDPPEIPEDLKQALKQGPRQVSIDEVNNPDGNFATDEELARSSE